MSVAAAMLEFREVSVPAMPEYDSGVAGVSLQLGRGELALVRVPTHHSETPLADVAMGLVPPEQGSVCFEGRSWADMSSAELLAARARFGRVFSGPGWVSNLDMNENILIKQRHHRRAAQLDAEQEMTALARAFGVDGILDSRPAWVSRSERGRAQWVRALTGLPDVLVLEHPDREVDAEHMEALTQAVESALRRGTSVLWVTSNTDGYEKAANLASQRFRVLNGMWLTETI